MSPSVEEVLADFRAWLEEATRPAGVLPAPASPPVDVATILGHFVALRQEVNLQTRAVRAQQEQNAEVLARLARDEPGPPRDLLLPLVEAHDSLSLAAGPVERASQSIQELLAPDAPPTSARSFWSRWFGTPATPPAANGTSEQVHRALDGLVSGYQMSLQRLERAMAKVGLEAIPAVGQPFDPELMEAMDTVAGTGRPAGEVVEEVRRGYRLQGRTFRAAQVRVARG